MTDATDTASTRHVSNPNDRSRLWAGFGWGAVATVAMSLLMLIGMGTGMAPMPEPIPKAIVTTLLGGGLPVPVVMGLAAGSHLLYGGVWGAVLARSTSAVTVAKGLGLGVFLWLLMQVAVLPLIGWGVFGVQHTPKIAGATLVIHLVYGAVLGWLLD